MMARAYPQYALRPFLAADAAMLAEIFRSAVEGLTGEDYGPSQQEAWAGTADDEAAFTARLGKQLTLIATLEGSPVGFASLQDNKTIDMLYVHSAIAGQGIGTMLVDALEKLAAARGSSALTVDASDSAREFFLKRGYEAYQRNTISVGNEWLANTTMKKTLGPKGPATGAVQ